jgi:hypothetical protein
MWSPGRQRFLSLQGSLPSIPDRGQRRFAARPRLLSGALPGHLPRTHAPSAAGAAELFRVSPPEAVVYLNQIIGMQLYQFVTFVAELFPIIPIGGGFPFLLHVWPS